MTLDMLPPVLEIFVLFHPKDSRGEELAQQLSDHFHGSSFSGLIGGAVAVYTRSEGWQTPLGAPRPIPVRGGAKLEFVPQPEFTAVVPVLSLDLARAVEFDPAWCDYIKELTRAQRNEPNAVGIFPVAVGEVDSGCALARILGSYQRLAVPSGIEEAEPIAELICRDLAQGITQHIDGSSDRLQVFISHTRRSGAGEENVTELIRLIREIVQGTRLQMFFDASDLQPGEDWDEELRRNAARSAMLSVRTDLYASREWCQREMLIAKHAGMPIVILDSLGRGEERGSFLMDHIGRVPVRCDGEWSRSDVRRGLNLLVDECLKRTLWRVQQRIASTANGVEVEWWAPHAPEPVTLTRWFQEWRGSGGTPGTDGVIRVLHPDPPLGADERAILSEIVALTGIGAALEVMTPRQLAARGV